MLLWTVRVMDGVNFSRLLKFYQTTFTVRSTSTKLPTKWNKFAWVKLSLDCSLRFCSLSLTRHNDNILGKKIPPPGGLKLIIFIHHRTSQKGVFDVDVLVEWQIQRELDSENTEIIWLGNVVMIIEMSWQVNEEVRRDWQGWRNESGSWFQRRGDA